ncbi:PPR3A phosphatase, partial [Polyodon spathula]|nr:PPR3A phosphatase [Polyodon spathula]
MSANKALSFLTIPGHAVFGAGAAAAAVAEGDSGSVFEEEDPEDAALLSRLLPKSSPIPRRRGLSLVADDAEYLLAQAPALNRKVSFADSKGLALVQVKFFHKFDQPDESPGDRDGDDDLSDIGVRQTDSARVTSHLYQVSPAFAPPTESELLETLRAQKVTVASVSLTADPLSTLVSIRVLNVSYQKSVYVRATMDNWTSYFDHVADYIPGSFDGQTDQFAFKLTFSPPFLTDGARIEFVVRYETPGEVFWANNGGQNYAVTLKVSQNETLQSGSRAGDRQDEEKGKRPKGILKPAVHNREAQQCGGRQGSNQTSPRNSNRVLHRHLPGTALALDSFHLEKHFQKFSGYLLRLLVDPSLWVVLLAKGIAHYCMTAQETWRSAGAIVKPNRLCTISSATEDASYCTLEDMKLNANVVKEEIGLLTYVTETDLMASMRIMGNVVLRCPCG